MRPRRLCPTSDAHVLALLDGVCRVVARRVKQRQQPQETSLAARRVCAASTLGHCQAKSTVASAGGRPSTRQGIARHDSDAEFLSVLGEGIDWTARQPCSGNSEALKSHGSHFLATAGAHTCLQIP